MSVEMHIEHKGGVSWDQMPAPKRFRHKHRAHTTQWDKTNPTWGGDPLAIDICRCGATTHMWFRKWSDGHRFGGLFTEGRT